MNSLGQDCLGHLDEEATYTDAYTLATPSVDAALDDLLSEFSSSFCDQDLLKLAQQKSAVRVRNREAIYQDTVCNFYQSQYLTFNDVSKDFIDSSTCLAADNTCKHPSCRGEASLLIMIQVAISANGCKIFVWSAAKGRCNSSRSSKILFGSNHKPSTYDPCNCAKVCHEYHTIVLN